MTEKKKYSRLKQRTFWTLMLLLLWEAGVKLSHVSPLLFPSVEEVFKTLISDLFSEIYCPRQPLLSGLSVLA